MSGTPVIEISNPNFLSVPPILRGLKSANACTNLPHSEQEVELCDATKAEQSDGRWLPKTLHFLQRHSEA
jgi:hypothetical protein